MFLAALERLVFALHVGTIGGDRRATRYRHVIDSLRSGEAFDGFAGPLALTEEDKQNLLSKATGNLYKRSGTVCKYLLKRLSAEFPGDQLVESLEDVSVEHVLPTNPGSRSQWLQAIPDPQDREKANRSLGNLVLLSVEQNKKARNAGLQAKLRVYFPNDEATPHALTNELRGLSSWTLPVVMAREARLMETLRKIAGISGGQPADRARRG